KPGDKTELKKSPSFDFGFSYDARSAESDQTPLLYPEKTLTRSSSLGSRAKFSNLSAMRAEYSRNLLKYETVTVEENTNRIERNDYQA
ncbi:hypothetical protein HAX54_029807, partial [Datura stramonium]|nr:hypothetical protein [Datura stramonium]